MNLLVDSNLKDAEIIKIHADSVICITTGFLKLFERYN